MKDRSEFLIFGRALHNALRHSIEDGDGRKDEEWISNLKPHFEHYSCVMYLSGFIAYLEDKYCVRPWEKPGNKYSDFDDYIANCKIKSFNTIGVSKDLLDALVCIRNAVIHNGGDLSKNRDKNSYSKVISQKIPNISLKGPVIKLHSSDYSNDFMEIVRQCCLAVAMYNGDG